jgi:hypothetical protein
MITARYKWGWKRPVAISAPLRALFISATISAAKLFNYGESD